MEEGIIIDKQVPLRKAGNFFLGDVSLAQYIEVVPRQVVGIAAGLIPFLQNNDIARALMGTQQMSQAVPLVKPEKPIVGTGIEKDIAYNTNALIVAEDDGFVEFADATKVVVNYGKGGRNQKLSIRQRNLNKQTATLVLINM
ncbi:MAG: hypothetical protein KatS3mg101_0262 [Patescibacteria group bacterium]|nr:MAG: hypothetical protein KatS3mg101_0262 [Patescibacteria group bacterium]